MEPIPPAIAGSGLWNRLRDNQQFCAALLTLRTNAAALADTISRSLPHFTDHSIRHMDTLWCVADSVLSPTEFQKLSIGEAFLLALFFYFHDIGMALGATEEGLLAIRESQAFSQFIARLKAACSDEAEWERCQEIAELHAFSYAARMRHAAEAGHLATELVPGSDIYLLEPRDIRDSWGATAGKISMSHHWNLDRVHHELGQQGI